MNLTPEHVLLVLEDDNVITTFQFLAQNRRKSIKCIVELLVWRSSAEYT